MKMEFVANVALLIFFQIAFVIMFGVCLSTSIDINNNNKSFLKSNCVLEDIQYAPTPNTKNFYTINSFFKAYPLTNTFEYHFNNSQKCNLNRYGTHSFSPSNITKECALQPLGTSKECFLRPTFTPPSTPSAEVVWNLVDTAKEIYGMAFSGTIIVCIWVIAIVIYKDFKHERDQYRLRLLPPI